MFLVKVNVSIQIINDIVLKRPVPLGPPIPDKPYKFFIRLNNFIGVLGQQGACTIKNLRP